MIQNLLQSVIILGITWVFYNLFLKKEISFKFNRFYLLGTLVLSFIIPFLQFEISNATPILFNLNPEMISSINELSREIINPITIQEFKRESIFSIPLLCYGLITTLLIIRFSRNIFRL